MLHGSNANEILHINDMQYKLLGVRRKRPLFGVGEIRNLWENCEGLVDYHIMDDNFI